MARSARFERLRSAWPAVRRRPGSPTPSLRAEVTTSTEHPPAPLTLTHNLEPLGFLPTVILSTSLDRDEGYAHRRRHVGHLALRRQPARTRIDAEKHQVIGVLIRHHQVRAGGV